VEQVTVRKIIMRRIAIGATVGVMLLSLAGCSTSDFEPFAPVNKRAPSYECQLASALEIPVVHEQQNALSTIALDAANVGDVHWAKQALKAIGDWEVRDDASLMVAGRLCRGGKKEAAVEIAETIASSALRDEALKFIRKPR
jgi:hypothetical protein